MWVSSYESMDIIKPVILENKKSSFTWQFIDRVTSMGNDSKESVNS